MESKLNLKEEERFILWDNISASRVSVGRTTFEVTSTTGTKGKTLENTIKDITLQQIKKLNKKE